MGHPDVGTGATSTTLGRHGGPLVEMDGGFVELSVYESGVPPRFRLYFLDATRKSDLTVVQAHEITKEVEHELLHNLQFLAGATIHVDRPPRGAKPGMSEVRTRTETCRCMPIRCREVNRRLAILAGALTLTCFGDFTHGTCRSVVLS